MKIIQFRCEYDPPVTQLKQIMVDQCNTWSRLQRLANDPDYTTSPFNMDNWRVKLDDPHVHWVDWDAIYDLLGDDGRFIADQMFGTGPLQGVLRLAPLVQAMPDIRLELVDVSDPVAAGYLPEPATGVES